MTPNLSPSSHRKGAALLLVMGVLLLGSLIAAALLARNHLLFARVAAETERAQSLHFLLGAEELARQILAGDAATLATVTHRGQDWAKEAPDFPVPRGALALRIDDAQALFNLASLCDGTGAPSAQLARLLQALGLSAGLAPAIAQSWAKLPASLNEGDVSWLRTVPGMDETAYRTLLPYVVVLPDALTRLNVNTASPILLAAFLPQDGVGPRLLAARARYGFLTALQLRVFGADTERLGVTSRYFRITARYRNRERLVTMTSLLRYAATTGAASSFSVVSRHFFWR